MISWIQDFVNALHIFFPAAFMTPMKEHNPQQVHQDIQMIRSFFLFSCRRLNIIIWLHVTRRRTTSEMEYITAMNIQLPMLKQLERLAY